MHFMITHSGRRVDLPLPQSGQVHIHDVAHHLSRMPRFAGATRMPWSVAAHSLHVCSLAKQSGAAPAVALGALLHDAHEFLLGDIPSPVKALVAGYSTGPDNPLQRLENMLQYATLTQLSGAAAYYNNAQVIKHWDLVSLATERRDLLHPMAQADAWDSLDGIEPDTDPRNVPLHHVSKRHSPDGWAAYFVKNYIELLHAAKAA